MEKRITIQLILLSICLFTLTNCNNLTSESNLAPWKDGAWVSGKYRNLFAEIGYSQDSINFKLDKAYKDLFEGRNKIYFEVGDSMSYVTDIKNNDVRSEGMSYGMMVAVQLNKKDVFDRLWRWSKKHMQHSDGDLEGYFAWSCKPSGERNAQGPASDGELYFITSLIFASNRWGNNTGIDYHAEALYILDSMMSKTGEGGVTNLINSEYDLITFVPSSDGAKFTDPSYHVPAFYEVWAEWANDGRADYWRKCATKSREFLHKAVHPETGLTADYSEFDGTPKTMPYHPGAQFRFDSWRVPFNVALDYSWAATDVKFQQSYADQIQTFFYNEGLDNFMDQYNIDGTAPDFVLQAGGFQCRRHSLGLVATLASVSNAASNPYAKQFIEHLWDAEHKPYEDGYFDAYYDGFLYLNSLLHLSGQYQIIAPSH